MSWFSRKRFKENGLNKCVKIAFVTQQEGEEFIASLRATKGHKFPISIRFYRCDWCGLVHFTKSKERKSSK